MMDGTENSKEMEKKSEGRKKLEQAFLNPSMENLSDLESCIRKIWEESGGLLCASPIRVGRTDSVSYYDRVKESVIPETGRDNDAMIRELLFYFQGLIKWNSPGVMINITPPPLTLSVAAASCASLFNPNLAMDVPSGNLAFAELEVIKMLSDLAGWDFRESAGLMTFGGKGTVLYAIRTGLHNCCPEAREHGLLGEKIKVFSTDQGHPCHYENCEWLGIGRENCVRLPVLEDGKTDLDAMKRELWSAVQNGYKIACIIANGGSTLYTTVDDIDRVVEIRDELVREFSLPYVPHVHVDSVIGWAWLMFADYDFEKNPLGFSNDACRELRHVYRHVRHIQKADSFGADFHKTGFVPYLCSAFVCKKKAELYALGEENQAPLEESDFGLYAPFSFSLESSRAGTSALSAWISLKQLGKEGYQRAIGILAEAGCSLREHFQEAEYSVCRNRSGHGFAALAMLFPKELRQRSKQDLQLFSDAELLRIAKYNHRFYLYLLHMQAQNKIDFALDYVSKQTDVRGIKIGVIKLFPMSPFCDAAYLETFYSRFEELLETYDQSWETMELKDSPYRPKPFVTR